MFAFVQRVAMSRGPSLLFGLMLCLSAITSSVAEGEEFTDPMVVTLEYDPPTISMLEEEYKDLSVSFKVNHSALWEGDVTPPWLLAPGRVTVRSGDDFRLEILNGTFNVTPEDFLADEINETITLHAFNLGYVHLIIVWEQLGPPMTTVDLIPATTTKVPSGTTSTITTTTTPRTSTTTTTTLRTSITASTTTTTAEPSMTEPEPGPLLTDSPNSPTYDLELEDESLRLKNHEPDPVDHDPVKNSLEDESRGEPEILLEVTTKQPSPSAAQEVITALKTTKKPRPKKKPKPNENFNIYTAGATFGFQKDHQSLSEEQPVAIVTTVYFTDGGHDSYKVTILRHAGTTDMLFVIIISVFVGINTFMMGCQLNLGDVWAVLKKPIGPVVGFVSQFLFMPLASYGLAHLLLTGSNMQLGLFTLGCSPGGTGSNFWTLLLKGDLNLSMTMTFISTTCAIFMMPFWLYTLGQTILQKGEITIPFGNLIMSLITFTVPVGVGIVIRRYKPVWADFMEKLIRPFTFILLIVLNVLAIWNSMYIFRMMTWKIVMAGLCVAWGGYFFGASMAFLFRQKRPQIIAIAIETAIQNPGVTFMVLRLTLQQPDADMSAVAPVAQIFVTTLPLLFIYLLYKLVIKCRECCRRRSSQEKEKAEARDPNDVDAFNPLLVQRMDSSTQTPNGFKRDSTANGNSESTPVLTRSEREQLMAQRPTRMGLPSFPNMYAESNDQDLVAPRYSDVALKNQPSLNDDPYRKSEPKYVNFRNGKVVSNPEDDSAV